MNRSQTFTFEDIEEGLSNFGINISCGGCASVFFTGYYGEPHDVNCTASVMSISDLPSPDLIQAEPDETFFSPNLSVIEKDLRNMLGRRDIEIDRETIPKIYLGDKFSFLISKSMRRRLHAFRCDLWEGDRNFVACIGSIRAERIENRRDQNDR